MTANESLKLSLQFKELVRTDLSHAFQENMPVELIDEWVRDEMPQSRECIFTPANVICTMLLSAIQEDKSLQNGLNLFKTVFASRSRELLQTEEVLLKEEKQSDARNVTRAGRPKKYKSKLLKSYRQPISDNTAAYSMARKRLDKRVFEIIYEHSTDFGDCDEESWHGMRTHISDGTCLQLQDTEDIKSKFAVKGMEESYPQALLQVIIRQGTGQVAQYALGSRQESELFLVIPMIKKLEKNSLLLADDLYNTYYHFCLILEQQCHIIVPGKRDRNYKVIRTINDNDRIVEISKTVRPDYVSQADWDKLPKAILLRRICYDYPTKNGLEQAVLYTTVLDETITAADFVAKYAMRWDIEISIREIKTVMDINILRSKTRDMLFKELITALTACNMVRKMISKSADEVGIPPQNDIFQKCSPFDRTLLLDRKGRVFFKWSPGRYGYTHLSNPGTLNTTPKRKKTTLHAKN